MCNETDSMDPGRTYKVTCEGHDVDPHFVLYRLEWSVGVPRFKQWMMVKAFYTEAQAHRYVLDLPPDSVVHWRT